MCCAHGTIDLWSEVSSGDKLCVAASLKNKQNKVLHQKFVGKLLQITKVARIMP